MALGSENTVQFTTHAYTDGVLHSASMHMTILGKEAIIVLGVGASAQEEL